MAQPEDQPREPAVGDTVELSDASLLGFIRVQGEDAIPLYVCQEDLQRVRKLTLYEVDLDVPPPHTETT